jgi:hypothetical protein
MWFSMMACVFFLFFEFNMKFILQYIIVPILCLVAVLAALLTRVGWLAGIVLVSSLRRSLLW